MSRTLKLILASQSPRRRELLALTGYAFDTLSVDTDETFDHALSPEENVMNIALLKAEAVFSAYPEAAEGSIILGADTTVVADNAPLGKPDDFEHGLKMLRMLQGRSHEVFTGFAILKGRNRHVDFSRTLVEFEPMSDDEIVRYLSAVRPYDKAGSYGIQDPVLSCFVRRIEGCYYNVVGLPLSQVYAGLKRFMDQ